MVEKLYRLEISNISNVEVSKKPINTDTYGVPQTNFNVEFDTSIIAGNPPVFRENSVFSTFDIRYIGFFKSI